MSIVPLAQMIDQTSKIAANKTKLDQLKKACDGLEANFTHQLLSAMRSTVQETKTGGDDTGSDTYRDMFDNEISQRLASRGSLGISKLTFNAMVGQVLNPSTPSPSTNLPTAAPQETAQQS